MNEHQNADQQPWAPLCLIANDGEMFKRELYDGDSELQRNVRQTITLTTSFLARMSCAHFGAPKQA